MIQTNHREKNKCNNWVGHVESVEGGDYRSLTSFLYMSNTTKFIFLGKLHVSKLILSPILVSPARVAAKYLITFLFTSDFERGYLHYAFSSVEKNYISIYMQKFPLILDK